MALPLIVPIGIAATTLGLVALRVRAIFKKKEALPKEALNNPAARPEPPANPAKREEAQKEVVAQVLAAPPPARVFKVGEIIGVDLFASGLQFTDFPNPVMNMKVTDLGNDPKILNAIPADKRIFIEPAFNQQGARLPFPIARNAIRPFPEAAGGLTGDQGPQPPIFVVDGVNPQSLIQIRLAPIPTRTLRASPMSTGDDVKTWQGFLVAKSFDPGPVDGKFGSKTAAATKAFQIANNLTADGIAGPQTFKAAAP